MKIPVIILFLLMVFLSGCFNPDSLSRSTTLNVSAAISLKDALTKIAASFEEKESTKIVFNFASSGDLKTQIEHGAPADVFISAGEKHMDYLEQKGLIDEDSRMNMLTNDLVVVAPSQSKIKLSRIEDLKSTDGIDRIAIGEPETVPAGQYARESFEKAGVWPAIQPKLVMGKDVRQVLSYVETGNVDAGFVYASDVLLSKDAKIVFAVPESSHRPIFYPIAVLRDARQPELAGKLIGHLRGDEASVIFKGCGLKPVIQR